MLALKIPKSILWAAFVTLLFLVMMSAYRMITQPIFSADTGAVSIGRVYWLGFRFDLRYVAIIVLPMVLFGLIPGFHLFRSPSGKRFSIFVFTFFAAIMFLLYGMDMAHQISFNERLEAGIAGALFRKTPVGVAFRTQAPWMIIFLVAGVGTWLTYLLIRASHHWIGSMKSSDNPTLRSFWQVLFITLLAASVYGRIGSPALGKANVAALKNKAAANAALNPFESLRQTDYKVK